MTGLIKTVWTLRGSGPCECWIEQVATPDGCVEVIRRLSGRSRWDCDQPELFVVGLVEHPQPFMFTGDAEFVALRLWPWAWNWLGQLHNRAFHGQWRSVEATALGLGLGDFRSADAALAAGVLRLADAPTDLRHIGKSIVEATSLAALGRATGKGPRSLQRWFDRHVGLPPKRYFNLLRFQRTLEDLPRTETSLADQAAANGFADQAHMAREFRRLASVPAKKARKSARGPFLR